MGRRISVGVPQATLLKAKRELRKVRTLSADCEPCTVLPQDNAKPHTCSHSEVVASIGC